MPLNMSFDDAKRALLNLTPEEQEKVYSEYPYLRMEKAQINQSLSNLAPEEQEEVFAELPEFRPKPAGGILDALTAAPSLAYQGTKEGMLGALSAVGENMPYPTENFMPVQPELQTQYQKSLEQMPYTPENIREVQIPEAQTAIQNIYQEKNLQPGTVGGVAADVFTSMGQMAPIVGMSLVAPELAPAGLALLSTVSGGQKYNEARKAGYNEKEALLQGLGYGAAEFIGEKIGLDALVDGFKNVAKRPALVNIVREVLKNAGVEAGEESATQVIQNAIDIGAQKYNPTPQVKVPVLFEGVPYAALTGGLAGGLMGGGTSALGSLLESPTAIEPAPQNMEQTTADLTQPEVNVEDAEVIKAAEEEIKAEQAAQEEAQPPINIPRPTFERPQPPAENQVEMARRMLSEGYKPKDIITALRQRTAVTVGEAERLQGEAIPEDKGMTIQPTAPSNKLDQLFKREPSRLDNYVKDFAPRDKTRIKNQLQTIDKIADEYGNIEILYDEKGKPQYKLSTKDGKEYRRINKTEYEYLKSIGKEAIEAKKPLQFSDLENMSDEEILAIPERELEKVARSESVPFRDRVDFNIRLNKIKSTTPSPEPQQATEVAPKDITPQPAEPTAVKTPETDIKNFYKYNEESQNNIMSAQQFESASIERSDGNPAIKTIIYRWEPKPNGNGGKLLKDVFLDNKKESSEIYNEYENKIDAVKDAYNNISTNRSDRKSFFIDKDVKKYDTEVQNTKTKNERRAKITEQVQSEVDNKVQEIEQIKNDLNTKYHTELAREYKAAGILFEKVKPSKYRKTFKGQIQPIVTKENQKQIKEISSRIMDKIKKENKVVFDEITNFKANDYKNKLIEERMALSEGKPVPPEVLAEYPDLKVEQKVKTKEKPQKNIIKNEIIDKINVTPPKQIGERSVSAVDGEALLNLSFAEEQTKNALNNGIISRNDFDYINKKIKTFKDRVNSNERGLLPYIEKLNEQIKEATQPRPKSGPEVKGDYLNIPEAEKVKVTDINGKVTYIKYSENFGIAGSIDNAIDRGEIESAMGALIEYKGKKIKQDIFGKYTTPEKADESFGTKKEPKGDYLVAPMPSNQQQQAINTLAGLDQTDLIMMVEALDAIPEVKKRLRNERALGQFVKKDNGRIVLPAKMGQADKNMVAKVLAHELGHLVDWSTGAVKNKMPKGNIFAHIGAMAKYFKKTLNLEPGATPENLTAKERAKIRYKAKKETIQPDGTYDKIALKNRYRELIAEYIKDNNLIERETVVMELLDLTQKWWGITDKMMADEKYLAYLSKPSELYANAFSAFLTEPATFEALAPQTSQMIYDYMTEERPQFYQIYKMFQDAMQKGESLQNKITWLRDRIKLASEKRLAYKLTKAPETSTGTLFKKQYIDSMSALLDLAKVPGQKIDYDFINKIELYRNNRDVMEGYLLEFMPEINEELKKQGLSIDGIGVDAFLKRIIGERGLKFLDVVSKDMAEQMNAAIQAKYTPEQMKAINNTFVKIWEQRKKNILEPLKNNEFLPDEIIDYMLKTKDYQTWDVGEQYENLYSKSSPATGSVIKKQIGTFKAVANPAISTILKDLSLLRFLGKQMATKAVIDKLKQHGVTVPEAKKKYNGAFWQFVEPDSKSGQELVMLSTKDGIKGYYVDKGIAEALENKPLEINSIIKMMLLPNKIIRGSFTGWNPAFLVLLNPIRDVQGSFLKMPYVLQNFGEWSKDMAVELYKAVTNTQNKKQIAEQTKAGNLIGEHESVLDPDLIKTEEQSIEAMYKGQQHDYKKYGVAVEKLMGLFDMFQALGKRLERFPKLAADKFYQAIKSKYNLSDAEINYFIRNFAGSPDFRRKGTQYANYNNLFLYSNAAKEGYRAHLDAYKYSKWEYFFKMFGASVGYMGALMLLESAFKDWWDKVPEYYKTNYYVIPSPFGHYDENGKPVFWTIPKDEASRFIGSAFRKIFKFNPEAWLESLTQIAAVGADELPMTSPIVKALGILSQAGTGVIPTDSRTGRPLISQRDWDIRTKEPMTTITALAKAISNQTGGGAWWKFDTTKKDNVATPSDIEKLSKMPMFGLNVLGRFLRVGDTENKFEKYQESKDRKGEIAYELTQIDRLVAEKLKPAFEKYNSVPKAIATLTREEKKLLSLHEVYFKDKMLEVSNPKLFKRKQDLLEQRRNKKFELNRNK